MTLVPTSIPQSANVVGSYLDLEVKYSTAEKIK